MVTAERPYLSPSNNSPEAFKLSRPMAPTLILQSLSSSTNLQVAFPRTHSFGVQNSRRTSNFATKCSSNPEPKDQFLDLTPAPESINTTSAEKFPIEKRRRSAIVRERKQRGVVKPEPPNFEIGWKRTKEINLEKPKGYVIMDFLEKFESLMAREFGSKELLAKAGEIVAERAREEAEVLRDEGKVEERMVTELFRVLRLMEMDLAMVKASVKEETLSERIEQARARCRQAILVANSF